MAGIGPNSIAQFTSSSGRTAIQYFEYQSGLCGAGANCNYRGSVSVAPGFDQVEVFLCGFSFRTDTHSAPLGRISATINKYRYDKSNGSLEVGVAGQLGTDGQPFSYELTFVVVLTDAKVAHFTDINTGGHGVGDTTINRILPEAIPPNMHYIGLGTRNWDIGTEHGGPVPVNTLAGHISALSVSPPQVQLGYTGSLTDASGKTPMFCEWGASVIAFDPNEMAQNASSIFPQYTTGGHGISAPCAWTEHNTNPNGQIRGFLDAFDGVLYFYPPTVEHDLWSVRSAAGNFAVTLGGNIGLSSHEIFLGDAFGQSTAAPYAMQMSRAYGFLL